MLKPEKKKEAAREPLLKKMMSTSEASPLRRGSDKAEAKQKAELLKAVEAMNQKLKAIENQLASQALQNSDDKYFVEPYQIYLNLMWLNADVGTGGGDVRAAPTTLPPTINWRCLRRSRIRWQRSMPSTTPV